MRSGNLMSGLNRQCKVLIYHNSEDETGCKIYLLCCIHELDFQTCSIHVTNFIKIIQHRTES